MLITRLGGAGSEVRIFSPRLLVNLNPCKPKSYKGFFIGGKQTVNKLFARWFLPYLKLV